MREDDAKDELRQEAARAQGRVEAASVVIASARDRVADAVAARNASAQRAISRIAEITSGDGLDDGWWDDWGADAVAALASIADVVSQIAGVLALVTAFIPGLQAVSAALFAISAVAGAISMIANLALAATGEKSWTEVGVAVATSALSVVGLGAAGAGAKLLSKAVLRPSTFNAIQKAVCKLPFGQCFVAGTLVHTPDGPRPIEHLRAGDKVWSRNPDTGTDEIQLVNETFVRTADTLYHLSIDGHTVSTTAEHPFMVEGLGWIEAQFLQPGDLLVTLQGTVRVEHSAVERRASDVAIDVYNFEVDTRHNYYVFAGGHSLCVHNATRKSHGGGTSRSDSKNPDLIGAKGTKIDSKTLWNKKPYRIDVENPDPGGRDGDMHFQEHVRGRPSSRAPKYHYDFDNDRFDGMPNSLEKKMKKEPGYNEAIEKGKRYLGMG